MKKATIIFLAMLIAFATTIPAMAAGTVKMNDDVAVSAEVKNTASYDIDAAVKLIAYDIVGNAVGHVCREVILPAETITKVSYLWRAPDYETGLYWSSEVMVGGLCANHDADDTDSDSDSDGDSDDSDA